MNKLYLRVPASHIAAWPDSVVSYALCSNDGHVLGEGRGTLTELSDTINKSKITLIIAASDVTILRLTVPPMSEAKLKLAVPNLVEDQLASDISDCVLMLGAKPSKSDATNVRTVAVALRSWLQQISKSLFALGASHVRAMPEQLCIPYQENQCSARLEEHLQNECASLALRFDGDSGMGVLLGAEQLEAEQNEHGIEQYLDTLVHLSPSGPISLEISGELIDQYKAVIVANPAWAERVTVRAFNWADTIQTAKTVSVNLMSGINIAQAQRIQWQIWRWPLLFLILVVVVNIIGLNSAYWGLKREVRTLNMGISQTYKVSFPKDVSVPFPLQQMKKNLSIAQRNSGQAAATDFTVLLTELGSAWRSINPQQLPKLVSVEYKDKALLIQIKGALPQEELQRILSSKGLSLKKNNAEVWQIKVTE